MKLSDTDGHLAPRKVPDQDLISRALKAYISACTQAAINPHPIDPRRSLVRRHTWGGGYDRATGYNRAIVILKHGQETVAVYEIFAHRYRSIRESRSRLHWEFRRAYLPEQLRAFKPLFAELESWWSTQATNWWASGGGPGSFVLGAGIAVHVLRPRCRKTEYQQIIDVPCRETGGNAGGWEPFVDEILARLKAQGIEASYDEGRLD